VQNIPTLTPQQAYYANKITKDVGDFLEKVPVINAEWNQLGNKVGMTLLEFAHWIGKKPEEQPQQSDDKQKFSKLYEMPGVEEKLLKYQQKENEKKEQLLKEKKEKEQKEQLEKDKKMQEQLLKNQQPNEILQKIKNKNSKVFDLFSNSQSQEPSTVKPEEQQESNKRKREEDNDLNEKQKKKCTEKAKNGCNQSSTASKPTAFEVLSEAAKDIAKFAQAIGNGLVEGASEAVNAQLEFIKDLATKPLETLEKEYVTPLKEILKDIILSVEFNEVFYSLSNSEIRQKALDHFGKDFVDNVKKFKTTWNMDNNLQRAEITGRIVGGILANKTINNFGKKVFSGGIKRGFRQEKILWNITNAILWTVFKLT